MVDLCQAAGLVWGRELIFDATKVRANADIDSLVPRWYAEAKAHVGGLFAAAPATCCPEAVEPAAAAAEVMPDTTPEDTAAGDATARTADPPPPVRLPCAGMPEEAQQLAAQNAAVWKLLDQYRLAPDRPPSCSYQRVTDRQVSTTDPDAVPMRAYPGDRAKLGYHDHYVVDGGKARIILAAFVTPADEMENTPMLDLLRRARFRWHLHPERAVGDTTYGTVENIRALEDEGIRAYVPLPNFDERTPYFGASHFTYDPEHDAYRCPQGQPLRRLRTKYTEEVVVYRAATATCNDCPLKAPGTRQ